MARRTLGFDGAFDVDFMGGYGAVGADLACRHGDLGVAEDVALNEACVCVSLGAVGDGDNEGRGKDLRQECLSVP